MTDTDVGTACIVVAFIIFALGIFMGATLAKHTQAGPGRATADVFLDQGEWYSQDGCWVQRNGYWRPLKRCNIVRVQK